MKRKKSDAGEHPIMNQMKRKKEMDEIKNQIGLDPLNAERSIFKCRLSLKTQLYSTIPPRKIASFHGETLAIRLMTELLNFHSKEYQVGTIDFVPICDGNRRQLAGYNLPANQSIIVQYKLLVIGFAYIRDGVIYYHTKSGWSGFEKYLEIAMKEMMFRE